MWDTWRDPEDLIGADAGLSTGGTFAGAVPVSGLRQRQHAQDLCPGRRPGLARTERREQGIESLRPCWLTDSKVAPAFLQFKSGDDFEVSEIRYRPGGPSRLQRADENLLVYGDTFAVPVSVPGISRRT